MQYSFLHRKWSSNSWLMSGVHAGEVEELTQVYCTVYDNSGCYSVMVSQLHTLHYQTVNSTMIKVHFRLSVSSTCSSHTLKLLTPAVLITFASSCDSTKFSPPLSSRWTPRPKYYSNLHFSEKHFGYFSRYCCTRYTTVSAVTPSPFTSLSYTTAIKCSEEPCIAEHNETKLFLTKEH